MSTPKSSKEKNHRSPRAFPTNPVHKLAPVEAKIKARYRDPANPAAMREPNALLSSSSSSASSPDTSWTDTSDTSINNSISKGSTSPSSSSSSTSGDSSFTTCSLASSSSGPSLSSSEESTSEEDEDGGDDGGDDDDEDAHAERCLRSSPRRKARGRPRHRVIRLMRRQRAPSVQCRQCGFRGHVAARECCFCGYSSSKSSPASSCSSESHQESQVEEDGDGLKGVGRLLQLLDLNVEERLTPTEEQLAEMPPKAHYVWSPVSSSGSSDESSSSTISGSFIGESDSSYHSYDEKDDCRHRDELHDAPKPSYTG